MSKESDQNDSKWIWWAIGTGIIFVTGTACLVLSVGTLALPLAAGGLLALQTVGGTCIAATVAGLSITAATYSEQRDECITREEHNHTHYHDHHEQVADNTRQLQQEVVPQVNQANHLMKAGQRRIQLEHLQSDHGELRQRKNGPIFFTGGSHLFTTVIGNADHEGELHQDVSPKIIKQSSCTII